MCQIKRKLHIKLTAHLCKKTFKTQMILWKAYQICLLNLRSKNLSGQQYVKSDFHIRLKQHVFHVQVN